MEAPEDEQSNLGRFTRSLTSCFLVQEAPAKDEKVKLRKGNHYCDLVVTTMDIKQEVGKYLVLIEILSHGTRPDVAHRKMTEQMICVLQQPVVFGVIFSGKPIFLMKAAHHPESRKYRDVLTTWKSYKLPQGDRRFNVFKFQEAMMDIYSCLLHGLVEMHL